MTGNVLVWTPSGSCPLCLTPPCYQLQKPPILSAALFLAALRAAFGRLPHRAGNHKSRCGWTPAREARNDLFIISRREKKPAFGVHWWCEGVNHGGFAGRQRAGSIERTADEFGSVQQSVPRRHGSGRG